MFLREVDPVTNSTGEINQRVVGHAAFQSLVRAKHPETANTQFTFTSQTISSY